MRVIAGSAGGVRLAVPKRGVRPTMDRVKAAIFSSLGDAIVGARNGKQAGGILGASNFRLKSDEIRKSMGSGDARAINASPG